ncbi:MAG: ATP-dependent RecD-like DNA helicase [Ruminococcaceae bacterium]|nr:ATP-dependent RecD-like DNA helicase [Oscillospiraceae bacterium]
MPEKTLLELTGSVEHIIYHNEKNQYTVLEMLGADELITVVGTFPYISEGEELKVYGNWTSHPSFGVQFKAEAFEKVAPKSTAAVLKYLSGGAVKGIGPVMAQRIVETFGEQTLDVIENDPLRLAQVRGISPSKARDIQEEYRKVYGIRELMMFLSEYGIKPEEAVRIWKVFGPASMELIKSNPYIICGESIMADFSVADSIANSFERTADDPSRVTAGLIYVLRHNSNNGHTALPADKLATVTAKMLGISEETVLDTVSLAEAKLELICREIGDKQFVFLPSMYECERFIAERLSMIIKFPPKPILGISEEIDHLEKKEGIRYAEKQREAIKAALEKGLLILTGGPGTGKTTTLKAIIRFLKENGETVFLAAPTGRAAKRMSELTGEEAKTVHRMLQVDWDESDNPIFTRNDGNPLECDAVIVDELSMIDSIVFEGILHALPLGCRLILVGDSDQLPSVGPGNILGDMISSGYFPTVHLDEIFRQSMDSLIVLNAHKIVKGETPELTKKDKDFFFLPYEHTELLSYEIVNLYKNRLPKSYGYSPLSDIQVLCPGRKGELGTINLNRLLREAINPPSPDKRQAEIFGTLFREGDKVMQIKNDYKLPWEKDDGTQGEGVFNGDMGIISEIDKVSGSVRVLMDDREVLYDFEKAGSDLEHAYAVTVHKSQGNEFTAVIMPVLHCTSLLCYRNLLYTAITRAKDLLILTGSKAEIMKMIENDKKTRRYTGLPAFLNDEFSN